MNAPAQVPKMKTALIAMRQSVRGYEAFDGEGVSLGTASTPTELWQLLDRAMNSVDEVEMPTPEQVTLENMVRETGATVGAFIEGRHPGTLKLFRGFLRGATTAKQKGYFED